MSKEHGGGYAFPTPEFSDEKQVGVFDGMSMRDYFAAQAVAAFIAHPVQVKTAALVSGQSSQNVLAIMAYEIADAMIAERDK